MQDFLDQKLIKRLLRPIEQPGVINIGIGWEIVGRSQKFSNRLPLLSHLTKRLNRKTGFQGEQIPIVYAEALPQEIPGRGTFTMAGELGESPTNQRTVVQGKFAPGREVTSPPAPLLEGEGRKITSPLAPLLEGEGRKTPPFPRREGGQGGLGLTTVSQPADLSQSPHSQTRVIQAKFSPGGEGSLLPPKSNSLPIAYTQIPQQLLNYTDDNSAIARIAPPNASASDVNTSFPIQKTLLEENLTINLPNLSGEMKGRYPDFPSEDLFGQTSQNSRTELGESPHSQTRVIQAKFSPGGEASLLPQKPNSLPIAYTQIPQQALNYTDDHSAIARIAPPNAIASDVNTSFPIQKTLLEENLSANLPDLSGEMKGRYPDFPSEDLFGQTSQDSRTELGQSSSSQTRVIQAKFSPGGEGSLLPQKPNSLPIAYTQIPQQSLNYTDDNSAIARIAPPNAIASDVNTSFPIQKTLLEENLSTNLPDLSGGMKATHQTLSSELDSHKLPDLYGETQNQFSGRKSDNLSVKPITNPKAIIQNPIPVKQRISWSGLAIPLIFSTPSAKTELGQENQEIAGISRNETMNKTAGLSREVSRNIQPNVTTNMPNQANTQNQSNTQTQIDIDALTDKIERKLMQRLIIESERRGRTRWS